MRAHLIQAHVLEDVRDGIAQLSGGGQGEIDDAERNTEALGGHGAHELTGAGDLESGLLDLFGHFVEGGALEGTERAVHHAGAGDADGDDAVRFLDTVEGTRHEGVIAHGVGKDHELGAANGAAVLGQLGGLLDHAAHLRGGVHVDAGAGGGDVDRRADQVGLRQCFRNGANKGLLRGGRALFYERGVAADEVHAGFGCRAVECASDVHGVSLDAGGDEGDRGDGDALVDNRNAEFGLDALADLDELASAAGDVVVDGLGGGLHGGASAAQEGNAHGDGANVEAVLLDHLDRVENADSIKTVEHDWSLCESGGSA